MWWWSLLRCIFDYNFHLLCLLVEEGYVFVGVDWVGFKPFDALLCIPTIWFGKLGLVGLQDTAAPFHLFPETINRWFDVLFLQEAKWSLIDVDEGLLGAVGEGFLKTNTEGKQHCPAALSVKLDAK